MPRATLAICLITAFLTGCSTVRVTQPSRTANEELLISTAAHRAAAKIHPTMPKGTKIYLNTSDFSAGYDTKYAIGAIRAQLLRDGYHLVSNKSKANTVVSIRSGALSINEKSQLWLGIPSIVIPIPLSGPLKTPALNFLKRSERTGIAEVSLTCYDAHTGAVQDSVAPIYGYSYLNRWTILMVGWTNTNVANHPTR